MQAERVLVGPEKPLAERPLAERGQSEHHEGSEYIKYVYISEFEVIIKVRKQPRKGISGGCFGRTKLVLKW